MSRNITTHGNPVTILGTELSIGDKAPAFTLTKKDMTPASLKDFAGKTIILSVVPSIDTPTCSIETRRFNIEAGKLPESIAVLTVSKDLPFAAARWCAAEGIDKLITLSDYRSPEFGMDYGVLIKELHLLTRAIFVIDKNGVIRYEQFVPEVSKEPDYKAVIDAAIALAK